MTGLIKSLLQKTANTGLFSIYYFLARPFLYTQKFRTVLDPRTDQIIREYFPDMTVRHGAFKGMRYPNAESAGSNLLPKLLGSYEAELAPVIHQILQNDYSEIIDIGSAEGYYAIGLGMQIPGANILAFDTNPRANELCLEMAKLNGVADRLKLGAFCSADTLSEMKLGRKALIISDCEGYEAELFTPAVVEVLARHEILIEIHDFLNNSISEKIRKRFEKTHDITAIESIDDGKKVRTYHYPELDVLDESTKLFVLREWREWTMTWFYITPKI